MHTVKKLNGIDECTTQKVTLLTVLMFPQPVSWTNNHFQEITYKPDGFGGVSLIVCRTWENTNIAS